MEELSEEVNDYSMLEDNDIPSVVKEAAGNDSESEGNTNSNCKMRPDTIWNHIFSMKTPDDQKRFPKLSKIAFFSHTRMLKKKGYFR